MKSTNRGPDATQSSLQELFAQHATMVFRVAYRLTGSRTEAEDLTQDVFLGLPAALKTYSGTGSFEGWLRKITVRVAIARARKQRREVPLNEAALVASRAEPSQAAVDRVALADAIARLPEPLRHVFVLREVEGYTHAEIASLLGIRVGTSEVRVHRAKEMLRRLLRSSR